MINKQLNIFESSRSTSQEAIAETIASFNAYGQDYEHWQISFSGGKDSTALVTLTLDLIERELIQRPKTLTVMYADTRLELPPLQASAMQIVNYPTFVSNETESGLLSLGGAVSIEASPNPNNFSSFPLFSSLLRDAPQEQECHLSDKDFGTLLRQA